MVQPNLPSSIPILQTLRSRWRLVLSWALFFLVLVGSLVWLGHEDKRIRPAIPPTVNDSTITFSSRPDGIRTEAVDAAGAVETGYPGRLVWAEDRTSRIRSPFNGRIVRGLVKVGDRVQAGQPLAEIQSSDYARAEADYQLADANLQRAGTLYQAGILSKRELQLAEGEYRRAKAEFMRSQPAGTESSFSAAGGNFLLRSPINGVVAEMSINPGQEIRADQDSAAPLFLVTDPAQLWIWIDLGELDLQQLQPFRLPFAVTISSIAFRNQGFRGEVVQFSESLDPTTRTFRLRGIVQNPTRQLKGEMYVTVSLPTGIEAGEGDQFFAIPANAVFLVGEKRYVFVQNSETSFSRQEIRVAREIAGRAIVKGLEQNQRVVTDGNLYMQQILLRAAASRQDSTPTQGSRP